MLMDRTSVNRIEAHAPPVSSCSIRRVFDGLLSPVEGFRYFLTRFNMAFTWFVSPHRFPVVLSTDRVVLVRRFGAGLKRS